MRCALTFDDGPDERQTPPVLDALLTHGAVASFMLVGCRVRPTTHTLVQRMLREGHEIGHHGWDLRPMTGLDAAEIARRMQRTDEALRDAGAPPARFFRAPNLAVDATLRAAVQLPFVAGVLAHDWAGTSATTAEARAGRVLADPALADGAVIVLHDVQPEPHPAVATLDLLIPALRRRGFAFATLSQLYGGMPLRQIG